MTERDRQHLRAGAAARLLMLLAIITAAPWSQAGLIGPGQGDRESAEIRELREAAAKGDAAAAFDLGRKLADGDGVSRNAAEAESLLRKALDAGRKGAAARLGRLLLETSQSGADVERAAEGLRILRASAATDAESALTLGRLHARGAFVAADFDQAEAFFRQAMDLGSVEARFRLGELFAGETGFADQADPEKALGLLEEAFRQGSIGAGYTLVKLLREGKQVARDEKRAFAAVQAAADGGHPGALLLLGELCEAGSGVEADPVKARAAYQAAAEGGDPTAQTKLGLFFQEGKGGLPADSGQARKWFEQAAAQGFAPAFLNLALLFDEGTKTGQGEPDPAEAGRAVDSLVAAAGAGLSEAQDRLGSWYRDGRHVRRDLVAAAAWFGRAAAAGSLPAKINLAQVLEAGATRAEDLRTAFALYAETAQAGHPLGHFHFARLLLTGSVAQIDPALACAHYRAAADAGLQPAAEALKKVEPALSEEQQARAREIREQLKVLPWGG